MNPWFVISKAIIGGLVTFALIAWVLWRTLKSSHDPGRLIFKWTITGVVVVGGIVVARKFGWGPMLPPIGAAFGLILGILWAPNIGGLIAAPFAALYDGGGGEPEVKPLYSMAEARRKQGRFDDAEVEVRRQLSRFPSDFQGWILLAEINGEDRKDAASAIETVEELLTQPGHAPKNIAYSLNRCADWELKLNQSPAGAMRALQRIVDELPDTEFAQVALQRMAHIANPESVATHPESKPIVIRRFDSRLGLKQDPRKELPDAEAQLDLSDEEAAAQASGLLQRLGGFPEDNESREKLTLKLQVQAGAGEEESAAADPTPMVGGSLHGGARRTGGCVAGPQDRHRHC